MHSRNGETPAFFVVFRKSALPIHDEQVGVAVNSISRKNAVGVIRSAAAIATTAKGNPTELHSTPQFRDYALKLWD